MKPDFSNSEDRLREKAQRHEFAFREGDWNKMAALLDEQDRRRKPAVFWWYWGLPGLALLATLVGAWAWLGTPNVHPAKPLSSSVSALPQATDANRFSSAPQNTQAEPADARSLPVASSPSAVFPEGNKNSRPASPSPNFPQNSTPSKEPLRGQTPPASVHPAENTQSVPVLPPAVDTVFAFGEKIDAAPTRPKATIFAHLNTIRPYVQGEAPSHSEAICRLPERTPDGPKPTPSIPEKGFRWGISAGANFPIYGAGFSSDFGSGQLDSWANTAEANSNVQSASFTPGLTAGIFVEYHLSRRFWLAGECQYQLQRGLNHATSHTQANSLDTLQEANVNTVTEINRTVSTLQTVGELHYLRMPLYAGVKLGKKHRLYAGLRPGLLLAAPSRKKDYITEVRVSYDFVITGTPVPITNEVVQAASAAQAAGDRSRVFSRFDLGLMFGYGFDVGRHLGFQVRGYWSATDLIPAATGYQRNNGLELLGLWRF